MVHRVISQNTHKILMFNLRMIRKNNNLTQMQIAEKLNMCRSTYAYYETGKSLPDIFTLKNIASFYGVSIDDLLINK